MTGAKVISQTANFSSRCLKWDNPVPAALEFQGFFGGTMALTGRNLALGKPAPTIVGAPNIGTGYCQFQGATNYIDTGIKDLAEATFICVARAQNLSKTYGYMVSSYAGNSAGQIGSSLLANNTDGSTNSSFALADERASASGTAQFVGVPPESAAPWRCLVARMGANLSQFNDLTAGLYPQGTILGPRVLNGQTILIGSSHTGLQGLVDMGLTIIYSRVISDDEVNAVCSALKPYCYSMNQGI